MGPLSVSVSPGQENPPGRRVGESRKNRLSVSVYLERYLTYRGYVPTYVSTRGQDKRALGPGTLFARGSSLKTFHPTAVDHLRRVNSLEPYTDPSLRINEFSFNSEIYTNKSRDARRANATNRGTRLIEKL